jgi:glycosyltransferase involved in cell wall biosynthesis
MTLELLYVKSQTTVIYHCVDEIKAQPGMPSKEIEQSEDRLVQRANHVFVTSEKLYHTRKQVNSNSYLLPNVADYDHFSKARDGNLAIPGDMATIKKPIIGFVGALSPYKVDFDLLAFVAGVRPDWSIVLIGKVGEGEPGADASRLDAENIHLLGPRPYQDLPAYMQCFNVAIIPATVNEYTNAMFPMKFFEYLAAGKRVVSTNIESLQSYSQYVLLSEERAEFLNNIEKVLKEGNDIGLSERLALAKDNTYRSRTEKMLAIINGSASDS